MKYEAILVFNDGTVRAYPMEGKLKDELKIPVSKVAEPWRAMAHDADPYSPIRETFDTIKFRYNRDDSWIYNQHIYKEVPKEKVMRENDYTRQELLNAYREGWFAGISSFTKGGGNENFKAFEYIESLEPPKYEMFRRNATVWVTVPPNDTVRAALNKMEENGYRPIDARIFQTADGSIWRIKRDG